MVKLNNEKKKLDKEVVTPIGHNNAIGTQRLSYKRLIKTIDKKHGKKFYTTRYAC